MNFDIHVHWAYWETTKYKNHPIQGKRKCLKVKENHDQVLTGKKLKTSN